MAQSHEQVLKKLLENYRLFETYFKDHQVEEVLFEGTTYNFMDLLDGMTELSHNEHSAIYEVYIDQTLSEKSPYYDTTRQIADIGIARMAEIQKEAQ